MKVAEASYKLRTTTRLLPVCIVLSFLAHAFASVIIERFGSYTFGKALSEPAMVMVELSEKPDMPSVWSVQATVQHLKRVAVVSSPPPAAKPVPASAGKSAVTGLAPVAELPAQKSLQPELHTAPPQIPAPPSPQPTKQTSAPDEVFLRGDAIVPVEREKLVYQLSLGGLPIGNAELEASNDRGELHITSKIQSNNAVSAIYPVEDTTDTRLIKGRYLLTRIRQHEGSFVSDTGFNLMYQERKIFWVDRLKKRYSNEKLETTDTLDFVSGFYFMRLQPLQVGASLTMRLYDGDTTTIVPVTVLRQEKLSLPGMRSADTLVVQPAFAASGFFRNNRDLLIWFSNDENRVPVRFEATTPIGRVTAELVSSERVAPSDRLQTTSNIVPANKIQYK